MPGYGTSVAIPAAILVTLGFRPLFAVLASLIANSEPTTFGAVGIAETVLLEETAARYLNCVRLPFNNYILLYF